MGGTLPASPIAALKVVYNFPMQLTLLDQPLDLMPQRAVYRAANRTLYIADTHWGKAATFRAHHIPVPEGALTADLQRLSDAISQSGAQRLVILGDLLHTRSGRADVVHDTVMIWRDRHPDLAVELVRGNHDRGAGDPSDDWRITCHDAPLDDEAGFVLAHHPVAIPGRFVLCGHLHPTIQLHGAGRQQIKLPCFWQTAGCMVLPAFGSLTDGMRIRPVAGDAVYIVAGSQVQKLPHSSS